MSVQAVVMMAFVLALTWGGFTALLAIARKKEKDKDRQGR